MIKLIYVNKTLSCIVNNVNLFVIGVDRDLLVRSPQILASSYSNHSLTNLRFFSYHKITTWLSSANILTERYYFINILTAVPWGKILVFRTVYLILINFCDVTVSTLLSKNERIKAKTNKRHQEKKKQNEKQNRNH